MRLLLFNLATDAGDPLLAFACGWISRLAAQCQYIDVITMYRGDYALPANVRVLSAGREMDYSKPRRVMRFYRHLTRLLATRRYDACFAHMMPLFAGLAGPLLSARGIPTTLWYTHRQRSPTLWLGMMMSRRVVSADASSFPYATDKLRVIGHGIDTDYYQPPPPGPLPQDEGRTAFQPRPRPLPKALGRGDTARAEPCERRQADARTGSPLIVQVGRLAGIKHQATTLRAMAGVDARLALIGGGQDSPYEAQLRQLVRQNDLSQRVQFTGAVSADEARHWYSRADIAVNMTAAGSFDKAALESMACGLPTVVCNPAFAPLLGRHRELLLCAGPDDVAGLRNRLERLLSLSADERRAIGMDLRRQVQSQHSLPGLIAKLMAVLETGELPPA